ncbi:MAG: hypothetical protein KBB21_16545 [Nannocystaceae bacterium]|nr:hypothetical protein [Nannocystaceae bacterium]
MLSTLSAALAWSIAQFDEVDAERITLAWTAPPGCGSAEVWKNRTEALRGRPWPTDRALVATARVDDDHGRLTLSLSLADAGRVRTRTIPAQTCSDAIELAAVILGISLGERESASARAYEGVSAVPQVDERGTVAGPGQRVAPAAVGGAASPGTPLPAAAPRLQARRRTKPGLHGGTAAAVGPALGLPRLTARVDLLGSLATRRLRVEFGLEAWLPSTVAGTREITVRVHAYGAVARACYVAGRNRWSFPSCAGLHGAALVARGIDGLRPTRRDIGPWVSVGVSVAPTLRLGGTQNVALFARVEPTIAVVHPTIGTSSGRLVTQVPRFGTSFGLGIEIDLARRHTAGTVRRTMNRTRP